MSTRCPLAVLLYASETGRQKSCFIETLGGWKGRRWCIVALKDNLCVFKRL